MKNVDNTKKTYFFKPNYPKMSSKYITYQKKNFSLQLLSDESVSEPSLFTQDPYETREQLLKKLGFKINTNMNIYNLYMTPYSIDDKFKGEMNEFIIDKYQRLNKFYNFEQYVSKSLLYNNYKKFKNKYPNEYNYMFDTYSYPEEKDSIEKKFGNYNIKYNKDIWLVKPQIGSEGRKIFILTNLSDIILHKFIINKYLYNPHLIKGYKYDIRFLGLISSIQPIKLYLYNESKVRLSSEKYKFFESSINNKFMVLINVRVNILNKNKYKYPQNSTKIEDTNLWNFETYKKYLERKNIKYNKIFAQVEDIFIKLIISVKNKILKEISSSNLKSSNFYHLIGFDIILDENLKAYLIEANRRCKFRTDNDVERYYSYNILADTFNILGLKPPKKKDEFKL